MKVRDGSAGSAQRQWMARYSDFNEAPGLIQWREEFEAMPSFKEKLLGAARALGFDDVYLLPSMALIEPSAVDLTTKFAVSVRLSTPLASSPMDTVTEFEMALAMALLGGIGVVHRNMEREKQVEVVKRVKEHPPARLRSLYVEPGEPCGNALIKLRDLKLRDIPVVDGGVVLGYVSFKALEECMDGLKPVGQFVKQAEVFNVDGIKEARDRLVRGGRDTTAVVSRDGAYLGTLAYYDALEELTPALDADGRLLVAAAVSPFDIDRAKALDKYVDALVSDVAHFHNAEVLRNARKLTEETSADFIAGNVGAEEAVEDTVASIEKLGGLRVGIGGGSICTTPKVAGAYAPTLWAVASARDALEKLGVRVPVIADGGIRGPGDVVKALAAGASAAMLGYALAGADEASAPLIAVGGKLYKPYRGMASRGAMEKRFAVDRYSRIAKRVPEGIEGLVAYRGSVYSVVREMVEAIRAGLGYAGARNIEELWIKAKFIAATLRETIKDSRED